MLCRIALWAVLAITRLRRKLDRNSSSYLTSLTTSRRLKFFFFFFFLFLFFFFLFSSPLLHYKDALAYLLFKSRLCSYDLWLLVIHFVVICRPNELNDDPRYALLDQQGRGLGPRVLPQGPSLTSAPRNGPIDPTVPYAMPQKKKSTKKPRSEPSNPAIGRFWFLLLLWNPGKTNAVINMYGKWSLFGKCQTRSGK